MVFNAVMDLPIGSLRNNSVTSTHYGIDISNEMTMPITENKSLIAKKLFLGLNR